MADEPSRRRGDDPRRAARGSRRLRLRRPVPVPRQPPPAHPGRASTSSSPRCCVLVWLSPGDDSSVLVNDGFLWAAVLLTVAGVISITSGWRMHVDETRGAGRGAAAPSASRSGTRRRSRCGADCAAGRRGACCATRPRTRPSARGFVLVDAVDGTVVEHLVEDNPERGAPRLSFDARCVRSKTRSLHSVELDGAAAPHLRCWRRRASSPCRRHQGATAPRTPRRSGTAPLSPTGSDSARQRSSERMRPKPSVPAEVVGRVGQPAEPAALTAQHRRARARRVRR